MRASPLKSFMADDLMQYQKKLDQALRGVVKSALIHAATEGLPGDHHFYITFRTRRPVSKSATCCMRNMPKR